MVELCCGHCCGCAVVLWWYSYVVGSIVVVLLCRAVLWWCYFVVEVLAMILFSTALLLSLIIVQYGEGYLPDFDCLPHLV